jgi:hypothetical protein
MCVFYNALKIAEFIIEVLSSFDHYPSLSLNLRINYNASMSTVALSLMHEVEDKKSVI